MQSILLRWEDPAGRDDLVTELWELGTLGILEEAEGLRAFFDDSAAVDRLAGRTAEVRDESLTVVPDFPKEGWDPIAVGKQFWIAPSWIDQPTPPGRIRLAIDNPNAFGTGRHESTQLALEALEQSVKATDTVVDIGCGSGILSQAALLLGVQRVFSCDIHADAIATAKPQLTPRLFLGSADAVRTQGADIVLANISAKVIDRLWWELNRITKPNGLLILGGFIRDRQPRSFSPEKVMELGEWLCWLCRPRPAGDASVANIHSLEWW